MGQEMMHVMACMRVHADVRVDVQGTYIHASSPVCVLHVAVLRRRSSAGRKWGCQATVTIAAGV